MDRLYTVHIHLSP